MRAFEIPDIIFRMSAIFKKANTAVITGGASGIGLALAQKCISYGMKVLVADWDASGLDAAKGSLGEAATTLRVDVSKTEDWATIKSAVAKDFGGMYRLSLFIQSISISIVMNLVCNLSF